MTIYLDNLASTPIDVRVADHHRAAMLSYPANPHSSEHSLGIEAQDAIDESAESIALAIGSSAASVTFTPGASAALWLAIEDIVARIGGRVPQVAASVAEHPALRSALGEAEREGRIRLTDIPIDQTGAPRLDAIAGALANGTDLLCTMAANNEVGTISDLGEIGALVEQSRALHLVDASQAAGKMDMREAVKADLVVISGAKVYGPRRAGALIGALSEEAKRKAHNLFGSPDAPAALALAFAMQLCADEQPHDQVRLAKMRDDLQAKLLAAVPGLRVNGAIASRLAGSLHVSTPHLPGDAAVARLWGRVAISTGAACQSGVPGPSHVLAAMDIPDWARDGAVRIGLGRFNTEDDVHAAGDLIAAALRADEPVRRFA